MKVNLFAFHNEPNEFLFLSVPFLEMLSTEIDRILLSSENLNRVKAQNLEILICTYRGNFEVKPISKTNRGKYWSFQMWLPYQELQPSNKEQLLVFTHFLCQTLDYIFKKYNMTEKIWTDFQPFILRTLAENPDKYTFKPEKDEIWLVEFMAKQSKMISTM